MDNNFGIFKGKPASKAFILYTLAGKAILQEARNLIDLKDETLLFEDRILTRDDIRPAPDKNLKDLPSKLALINQNLPRIESKITMLLQSDGSEMTLESLVRLRDHIKLYQALRNLLAQNKLYLGNPIDSDEWMADQDGKQIPIKFPKDMRRILVARVERDLIEL